MKRRIISLIAAAMMTASATVAGTVLSLPPAKAIPAQAAVQMQVLPQAPRAAASPNLQIDRNKIKIKAVLESAMPAHYTVRPGDTLSKIAKSQYGKASRWPALWWVNRKKIGNPNSVSTGMVLKLSSWHPGQAWILRAAFAAMPKPKLKSHASHATVTSASAPAATGSPQAYALSLVGSAQYSCVNAIFTRESGWRWNAYNPSGAYGIPQALPGSKMASAGADWQTNPLTQVRWGINYMNSSYGSPCGAWAFWQSHGYY